MKDYKDFLNKKQLLFNPVGFKPRKVNDKMFKFQKNITLWAIRKGRAALFEDCGLGKTIQQLEWAHQVHTHTNDPVIIVTPLAVSRQTKAEATKFGYGKVKICESQDDVIKGINITNYQKLHKFRTGVFSGVVLDESSILKNMSGKIRNQIIQSFSKTSYKLACTATPSPNDYMELGNHAEFLGIMTYTEMLSMFFVNDSGDVGQWRLKKHANEEKFWEWLCSWAIMISKPSDIGYKESGFDLPKLTYHEIKLPHKGKVKNQLFPTEAKTLDERRKARKESLKSRCKKAAEIVNESNDQWVIWTGLNKESELLNKLIKDSVEITGSTDHSLREEYMLGFAKNKYRKLITKPSIAGFGMNWQNCNKMMFVGLSDSWEQLYQAVRRVWRFGQNKEVQVYIVIDEREGAVLTNVKRKNKQAQYMIQNMIKHTKDITNENIRSIDVETVKNYGKIKMTQPIWMKTN